MGAAGRDFHNFNVVYRDDQDTEVVAFTAAQIPYISDRKYPPELAGKNYPNGIPIIDESKLADIIKEKKVNEAVFSYSDVPYNHIGNISSIVNTEGARFVMLSPKETMIKAQIPVIAITAMRTGCGKSQVTRKVVEYLKSMGKKPVVVRHPMPYGDLKEEAWQRYETLEDLKTHKCTIEEMEEYEPHINEGNILYAGVDYELILKKLMEENFDVLVWDGGNNDTSFYRPDFTIVVTDPHRAGHETSYYPGETNVRLADYIVMNKVDSAFQSSIKKLQKSLKLLNPNAKIGMFTSKITFTSEVNLTGKSVVCVEDGPTITHGEMKFGAAYLAAQKAGARILSPLAYAKGDIKATFKKYPHAKAVLPAMGYGDKQLNDLQDTINSMGDDIDFAIIGTPIDLARIINIKKPAIRVKYALDDASGELKKIIEILVKKF